jgi:tyrosine-protein kinase Etk/Wzc
MKERSSSLIYYLSIIFKWRRVVFKTFLVITFTAAIISLLVPQQFTARASILPPNPQQDLGGFSNLANFLPGGTTTSDLFAAILQSGAIMGEVVRKNNLKQAFKAKTMADALKVLEGITTIRVSPEGIVSVAVTWYERQLAADIANSYVEELNKFNSEATMTVGKKYRLFIETRLSEATDALTLAENALKKFQEDHRTVALDIEVQSAIETIAELKSQIILLEVKKGALASSSQFDNPYLYSINRELRELKKQLAKLEIGGSQKDKEGFGIGFAVPISQLPEVTLEYARLLRNVKVQEAIFELLTQQYEQAKIMEVKDTPTVQILDRAGLPEKRSLPKRRQIVTLAALFSLILGVSVSFFQEWFDHLKKQPNEYAQWINIYAKISADVHSIKSKLIKIFKTRKV